MFSFEIVRRKESDRKKEEGGASRGVGTKTRPDPAQLPANELPDPAQGINKFNFIIYVGIICLGSGTNP